MRWEYKTLDLTNDEHWREALNKLGAEGWELVQIAIFGLVAHAIFKREIGPAAHQP